MGSATIFVCLTIWQFSFVPPNPVSKKKMRNFWLLSSPRGFPYSGESQYSPFCFNFVTCPHGPFSMTVGIVLGTETRISNLDPVFANTVGPPCPSPPLRLCYNHLILYKISQVVLYDSSIFFFKFKNSLILSYFLDSHL